MPPSTIVLDNIVVVLRRSPATVEHQDRHHAVVLTELIYYLSVLLDQEGGGRHRAERVLNAEVLCVRYLIGWITKKFDYINRVSKTLSLSVYEGTWTHSPLLLLYISLVRSCVCVDSFCFACNISQQWHPSQVYA